jgi:ribosome recycling factor
MIDPDETLLQMETEMQKALDHTLHEFANIHTGKASPAMVENLNVTAYGSSMQLKSVAAITTPDSRTIAITPFDKSTIQDVVKAIQVANIGINPTIMGDKVHCPLPELTKQRRQELVKICHGHAEQGKVGLRAARRDAMDALKTAEKDKDISEDDRKRYEKEVQAATDKFGKQIDDALKAKEADLLKV